VDISYLRKKSIKFEKQGSISSSDIDENGFLRIGSRNKTVPGRLINEAVVSVNKKFSTMPAEDKEIDLEQLQELIPEIPPLTSPTSVLNVSRSDISVVSDRHLLGMPYIMNNFYLHSCGQINVF
jgi:hypothetical protein